MTRTEALTALGLGPEAGTAEVKAAYRRLAREHHPDRNPDDPAAAAVFRRAAEAYRVLAETPSPSPAAAEPSGSVFDSVFGRRSGPKEPGRDVRYRLEIDLRTAARGGRVGIQLPTPAPCEACSGLGIEPASTPVLCSTCGGRGEVVRKLGFVDQRRTCGDCKGRGRRGRDCPRCDGSGEVELRRPVEVGVPAGVGSGTRLRIAGAGQPGRGGAAAGDLFVVIEVLEDPILKREGDDVVAVVPIGLRDAALGGAVEVPTLDGLVRVKVPAGTSSGRELLLDGIGFPGGCQKVRFEVEAPARLSDEGRAALESFAAAEAALGPSATPRRSAYRAALAARRGPSDGGGSG